MKLLQKIAFLILISFAHANMHAMHKQPDRRQQQQQARHYIKHQERTTEPSDRFARRHPVRHRADAAPSLATKALAVAFALMIITSPAGGSVLGEPAAMRRFREQQSRDHGWSAAPQEVSFADWPDAATTFGPCQDGDPCYEIQANYTVTRYSLDRSHKITFGLDGFVDDQGGSDYFDIDAALHKAQEECNARPTTFEIRDETQLLLNELEPRYLQQLNGSHCTVERPRLDAIEYPLAFPTCRVMMIDISNNPRLLPHLQAMITRLAQQFNVVRPHILIYDKDTPGCDFGTTAAATMPYLIFNDGFQSNFRAIIVPWSTLKNPYFDDDIHNHHCAHEMDHIKQFEFEGLDGFRSRTTGNNRELEAEIAATLATGNTCFAVTLMGDELFLRPITSKQAAEISGYPTNKDRIAAMVAIRFYDKRAGMRLGDVKFEEEEEERHWGFAAPRSIFFGLFF